MKQYSMEDFSRNLRQATAILTESNRYGRMANRYIVVAIIMIVTAMVMNFVIAGKSPKLDGLKPISETMLLAGLGVQFLSLYPRIRAGLLAKKSHQLVPFDMKKPYGTMKPEYAHLQEEYDKLIHDQSNDDDDDDLTWKTSPY